MKSPLTFLLVLFAFDASLAQSQMLTGKVLDETGQPLPFATVYVQNSTNGTTTNNDGEFRLNLAPGRYRVVFQYIGYKQKIESVEISGQNRPASLSVQLEPNSLNLAEVVIRPGGEDPAYAIMRQAIARRSYFQKRLAGYSCDAYVKGLYRMLKTPKKVLGKEVGNMGGSLDSTGRGIVYLSESVSKLYVQAAPERMKEVMISSKVSGDPNGFSLNRATLTNFSLYDENIEIERQILSPLADAAFSYYKFHLAGKFRDQNGHQIATIECIPKRSEDPTFAGTLYIVDSIWCLQGADLVLTGGAIHQPVLDTLKISQEFVPVAEPDGWALFSQVTSFKFGLLGFKIGGAYNSVFTGYDLAPQFAPKTFTAEVFKIEKAAQERDTSYWEKIRPVPLTSDERRDYGRKDSLHTIWKSKSYLDSIDQKNNRFGFGNLFFGYTWRNSFRHAQLSFPSVFNWLQFNSVQGAVVNLEPVFRKTADERGLKFWEIGGRLNYGFSEKAFRADATFRRRFNSVTYPELRLSGGLKTEQFNENQPISAILNTDYSLFFRRNFMKLYEKAFVKIEYQQDVWNGVALGGSVEFAHRGQLTNHSDYSFFHRERQYTSNFPVDPTGMEGKFSNNLSLKTEFWARFRFAPKYLSYPEHRINEPSKWPELTLRYRKAIPNVAGTTPDFDFLSGQLRQRELSFGILGHMDWTLAGGGFLRAANVPFYDFRHFRGNQTIFGNPDEYAVSFFMLPYYEYSTDGAFAQAHIQHHFEGYFLDKIPGIRKLNWKEVLGINVLWTDTAPFGGDGSARTKPYWEANFGLENIGFGAFRLFRVDVAARFFGGHFDTAGVIIGVNL